MRRPVIDLEGRVLVGKLAVEVDVEIKQLAVDIGGTSQPTG
jgi:hypothetical protein